MAFDTRVRELQNESTEREKARIQREMDDYNAELRGQETPTQREQRVDKEESKSTNPPTTAAPAKDKSVLQPRVSNGVPQRAATDGILLPKDVTFGWQPTHTMAEMRGANMGNMENQIRASRIAKGQPVTGRDFVNYMRAVRQEEVDRQRAANNQRELERQDRIAAAAARKQERDQKALEAGTFSNREQWANLGKPADGETVDKESSDYKDAMEGFSKRVSNLRGLMDGTNVTSKALDNFASLVDEADKGQGMTAAQRNAWSRQFSEIEKSVGARVEGYHKGVKQKQYEEAARHLGSVADGMSKDTVIKLWDKQRGEAREALRKDFIKALNSDDKLSPDYGDRMNGLFERATMAGLDFESYGRGAVNNGDNATLDKFNKHLSGGGDPTEFYRSHGLDAFVNGTYSDPVVGGRPEAAPEVSAGSADDVLGVPPQRSDVVTAGPVPDPRYDYTIPSHKDSWGRPAITKP